MPTISSRQHALVRQCRAIVRGDDPHLLLDGWHLVADALSAGLSLAWVAVDVTRAPADVRLLEHVRATGTSIAEVTSAVMDAMSPVRSSSGIVAVCPRPAIDPRALIVPAPALVLAALGVQDPGNVGTLLRSADAAAASGVLLDAQAADPWGWKALRASMGSAFRLPVWRTPRAIDHLRDWQRAGLRVAAADPREGASMYDVDLTAPTVIVLGAEGAGVPAEALALADARIRVPMRSCVESLNVGIAASLLVYEAARQRGTMR